MSDTFWVQFFLAVVVLTKLWRDEQREKRSIEERKLAAEERRLLHEELHVNTVETVKGNERADSAVREAINQAADAKKAANFSAARSVVIEKKADNLEKTANKIEERLNGGPDGLGNRVAKSEARLDALEQSVVTVVKSLQESRQENMAVAKHVESLMMSFSTFAAEYTANNKPKEG